MKERKNERRKKGEEGRTMEESTGGLRIVWKGFYVYFYLEINVCNV